MRNVGTAYLLLAMQFFGVAGLHRFYLGKPISGLLWFFTFGLGGLGTLYDLLTMEEQVDLANRRGLPAAQQHPMLPAASGYPQANPYMPAGHNHRAQPVAPAQPKQPLELRLLQAARNHRGRMTVMQAAAELGERTQVVEAKLDEMCHSGHANIEVSEDGVLYYDFPELRFS